MLTSTSSRTAPAVVCIVPNLIVYPEVSEMVPFLHRITLSAIANASGPLTLITEIAPVPGTVAGAQIVSSFLMYMSLLFQFILACFACEVIAVRRKIT